MKARNSNEIRPPPWPTVALTFMHTLVVMMTVMSALSLNKVVPTVEAWSGFQPSTFSSIETPTSSFPSRRGLLSNCLVVTGGILFCDPKKDGHSSAAVAAEISAWEVIRDPATYEGLFYTPPLPIVNAHKHKKSDPLPPPLIVVLHGAGQNDLDIFQDLADPQGEHAGLIPSLITSGQAPSVLLENFAVLAPYSQGNPSFYGDSRSKLLQFIEFIEKQQLVDEKLAFDPSRIFLWGFSDGATVAVELLTTKRFVGGVICSYGFTGQSLPPTALQRLSGLPIWVFHSADDVIFDVQNSDRLVSQLQQREEQDPATNMSSTVRYTRYEQDPEGLPPRVRGHSMGITASKFPAVYDWMLEQAPIS